MRFSLVHLVWALISIVLCVQINSSCRVRRAASLEAAQSGDRSEAETWINRDLRQLDCTFQDAETFLQSNRRNLVDEPTFLLNSVERFYEDGAKTVAVCMRIEQAQELASHLLITLPQDETEQDDVVAEVQSHLRRKGIVYGDLRASDIDEVEEYVRLAALVGETRILMELEPGDYLGDYDDEEEAE